MKRLTSILATIAPQTRFLKLLILAAALFLSVAFTSRAANAQAPPPVAPAPNPVIPKPVFLYPNGAPGALGNKPADKPRFYPFVLPQTGGPPKPAVLVLPGGGYSAIALGQEGFQLAAWLNAQGISAFVLDYRVAPYKYPAEIEDGVTAMRMIRAHASDYGIDPDKIGVWGSSAGGHLAAVLETECKVTNAPGSGLDGLDCQPNFAILAYPVISMQLPLAHPGSRTSLLGPDPTPAMERELSPQYHVTAATPPTFIFATTGDPVVPVQNSIIMYTALQKAGVPVELHLFDFADHGCGLCGAKPQLSQWPGLLRTWLTAKNILPPNAPPMPPPAQNMPVWPSGLDGPGNNWGH